MKKGHLETQVLIIGCGVTGTGLARDLSLRGVQCVLAEKGDLNAGASGANHGLLHSGCRYVANDPAIAKECRKEGKILRRVASNCIENTGGLFVAVEGDDEKYIADFPNFCFRSDIPVQELDPKDARELEPALGPKIIAAYEVEDASIDPFKLSLANIDQAQKLGSILLCHTRVVGFEQTNRRIRTVLLKNSKTGEDISVDVEQVVNAAGAWAGEIAALAGVTIDMAYSKGSLLVTQNRLATRVVNRLRWPSDGDILVPGGTVSILGTTSVHIDSLGSVFPTIDETDLIVENGAAMLPCLETNRYIRAYSGVRPLIDLKHKNNDRSISRGFSLLDHIQDGFENFATITGGKLTTFRYMAEKTADLVCRRLGVSSPCVTKNEPLSSSNASRWTEPGLSAKEWIHKNEAEDIILCECEIVPKSVVDSILTTIVEQNCQPNLKAISLRSRIGKGQCQGTLCGSRVTAYMYEHGLLHSDQGLSDLKEFLRERWIGERPILWNGQIIQAELKEALYCGLCSLEQHEALKK